MAVKSSKRKLRRETRSSVEFQGIGWMEEIIFVFYYKTVTEMRKLCSKKGNEKKRNQTEWRINNNNDNNNLN